MSWTGVWDEYSHLLQILHEEEEFCVPEDEEREEVTSVSKETDDIIRPFEELFFLDKSGASQIVDEVNLDWTFYEITVVSRKCIFQICDLD